MYRRNKIGSPFVMDSSLENAVRQLNDAEKRLLNAQVSSLRRREQRYRKRCAITGAALWVGGSTLTLLARRTISGWPIVVAVWGGIGVLIALWIILEGNSRRQARVRNIQLALRDGVCHVIRIRSGRVLEFEEAEDEGACYAFQVGDSVVFICGQEFYPTRKFPSTDFSLVSFRGHDGHDAEQLITTNGTKLQPFRTVPAKGRTKLRIPEHLEVVRGNLDEIEVLLSA